MCEEIKLFDYFGIFIAMYILYSKLFCLTINNLNIRVYIKQIQNNGSRKGDERMDFKESKVDLVFGIIIGIFSLLLYFVITPSQVPNVTRLGVSPRLLPNIIAFLLLILSISQIIGAFKVKDTGDEEVYTINPIELKLIGKSMLVFIAYFIAINLVGYIISTIAALAVFMLIFGQRNIKKIALVSVGLPIVIYIFFTKALQMILP